MQSGGRRVRAILLISATLLVFAVAWLTGRQVGVSTSTVTRLYDVRDLLVAHPDFNDPPALGASSRDPRPAAPPVAPANPTPATRPRLAVDPGLADLVRRIE